MQEKVSFGWIKSKLFADESKKITLKKGDVLINENQVNTRLFLVTRGKVLGFLSNQSLENYPAFEATENKFIGVYSYFAEEHISYSKVVATEDSEIYFYDKPLQDHTDEEITTLSPFFMSVLVNELYTRQHFAKQMAQEKYNDAQRLLKAEKMATLGQMAAGVAHELNNSIGVLDGSLDRLSGFINGCVNHCDHGELNKFFEIGLERGQETSSEEARQSRKNFEHIKGLQSAQIRKLAKTGLNHKEIEKLVKTDLALADKIYEYWEIGCTLHDMQIAAKHSTHVVRSVKQLGVSEHEWGKNVNINDTISEAMVILRNLSKRVKTTVFLDNYLPETEACPGQLVQVWINLVKNGIESMLQSDTPEPEMRIASDHDANYIIITVTDNGPGIPAEIIERIFEPSFTTKVGGLNFGLGLGLSVVQRIVTEHDAIIEVDSQPGNTVFTVKIPLIA